MLDRIENWLFPLTKPVSVNTGLAALRDVVH